VFLQQFKFIFIAEEAVGALYTAAQFFAADPHHLLAGVIKVGQAHLLTLAHAAIHGLRVIGRDDHHVHFVLGQFRQG